MGSRIAKSGRPPRARASKSVMQGLVAKFAPCGNGANAAKRCQIGSVGLSERERGAAMPKSFVYVSNADSREIIVLRLAEDGALAEIERVKTAGTVMPLALSPDRRFLFAA